jgi:hypothetical protein
MAMVTVTDNAGLPSVRIQWTQPNENGAAIQAYEIKILSSTPDTYFEATSDCSGLSTLALTSQYCDVQMVTLTSEPF